MKFAIFLIGNNRWIEDRLTVLYLLAGITSTDHDMFIKTGIQRYVEGYKIIVVKPFTKPRGCKMPDEDDDWDIGPCAGIYVDAT